MRSLCIRPRSREAAKHVSKSFREQLSRGPVGFSSRDYAELPGQIEFLGGSYDCVRTGDSLTRETIETLSGSHRPAIRVSFTIFEGGEQILGSI